MPVGERPLGEHVGLHQPFAVVIGIGSAVLVDVGIPHLHELGDDRTVGEQLDLVGQEADLAIAALRDDLRRARQGLVDRHTAIGRPPSVDQERRGERRGVVAEDRLVQLPRTRGQLRPRLVDRRHPVLMEVGHHLLQAADEPFRRHEHR